MKTLLQLILTVFMVTSLEAQVLTLSHDTFNVSGYSDAYEIIAYGTIYNTTSDSVIATWERVINDLPSGWGGSSVCDNKGCYLENVSLASEHETFTIHANGQSNLDVHFQPSDISGNGTVLLKAWVIGDSANTVVTGVYKATAQEPTVVETKENEHISIYPNPAKDYVLIKNLPLNEISTVEVFNIFGRKMLAFSQPPATSDSAVHKFDIGALSKGIYMIRVYDESMNVIFTKSLSKE